MNRTLVIAMLKPVINKLSGAFIQYLISEVLPKLQEKALETRNKYDDELVKILSKLAQEYKK